MAGKRKPRNPFEFTLKQRRFIDAYAGDAKAAAEAAGISFGYGRNLLTQDDVRTAIQQREATETRPVLIATRLQRQHFWSETMRDEGCPMRERLRASELLGKSEGDFIQRIEQVGGPVKRLDELSLEELEYMLGRLPAESEGDNPSEDSAAPSRPGWS